MDIVLGGVTLDGGTTSVRERYEEVGGRDARRITLGGVVTGLCSVEEVVTRLDAVLQAASSSEEVPLSIRPGRRLLVRRVKCSREVSAQPIAGAFTLELEAANPFEEAVAETQLEWPITESGQTLSVASLGNADASAVITLEADEAIVCPSFSDGTRRVSYAGQVAPGETLVFDGANGKATLEGVDVTAYVSGCFPRIAPDGTTLCYEDDAASSHAASVRVTFRDRWW